MMGQLAIEIEYARLPGQPRLSMAVIVKLKMPAVFGVPERRALEGPLGVSVKAGRPGGSEPVTVKVYGGVPPEAETVWL